MKATMLWNVTRYTVADVCICFRGPYCLHLQDRKVSEVSNEQKASNRLCGHSLQLEYFTDN
jgi:hypothetical protein